MNIKVDKLLNETFKIAVRSIGNILINKNLLKSVFNKIILTFKILKISDDELKRLFVDYSLIFNARRYCSEMCYVFEAVEKQSIEERNTVSARIVIDTLEKEYGMKPWLLIPVKQNGVTIIKSELNLTDLTVITVIIPKLQLDLDIIEKEMNKFGYYLAKIGLLIKSGFPYNIVMFNPYHLDSIKDYIKKNFFNIYHCNVAYHYDDVRKFGFVPRKADDKRKVMYPPRVFFTFNSNKEEYIQLMKTLYLNSENPKNDGTYILYTLDVSKIPDNIEFYADPNYPDSCYAIQTVPYSAVTNETTLKLK